jgi:hypothetical protein
LTLRDRQNERAWVNAFVGPFQPLRVTPLAWAEHLQATEPSRCADVPAFRPGSWYRDLDLLYPVSPGRGGR